MGSPHYYKHSPPKKEPPETSKCTANHCDRSHTIPLLRAGQPRTHRTQDQLRRKTPHSPSPLGSHLHQFSIKKTFLNVKQVVGNQPEGVASPGAFMGGGMLFFALFMEGERGLGLAWGINTHGSGKKRWSPIPCILAGGGEDRVTMTEVG